MEEEEEEEEGMGRIESCLGRIYSTKKDSESGKSNVIRMLLSWLLLFLVIVALVTVVIVSYLLLSWLLLFNNLIFYFEGVEFSEGRFSHFGQ